MVCCAGEMTGSRPSVPSAHLLATANCMHTMDVCHVSSCRARDIQNQEVTDMSPHFLFRSSGMALLVGSLFGLSWTLMSALILPLAHPNQFASPLFLSASLLMFLAPVAIVPGLVGWYAYQSARAGWLGFVGFALVFFGILVLGVGFGFIAATVIPWLTTHAPELLVGALPPLLTLCAIGSALMVGVGTIPLGIATMRAGVLPRWPGLLLILSGA